MSLPACSPSTSRSIKAFRESDIRFYTPDSAYAEAEEYLPALLARRGRAEVDPAAALGYLMSMVKLVDEDSYKPFENEARARLEGRDEDDWPVFATALALACPIWTEDTDFFGTGASVWTTGRVEILLKSLIVGSAPPDEPLA